MSKRKYTATEMIIILTMQRGPSHPYTYTMLSEATGSSVLTLKTLMHGLVSRGIMQRQSIHGLAAYTLTDPDQEVL